MNLLQSTMLRTNRGMVEFYVFTFLTLGIYALVVLSKISSEINLVASRRDGKHTMHFLLIYFIFSWLTLGIAPIVWIHRLCNRMGDELAARSIPYSFGAGSFWGWSVLGSLIFVGPFVFYHKFFKAMNLINADFNAKHA